MRHKLMGTILSLLMVSSVLTVGFASWTIVSVDAYDEITGDIQSENILNMSDYITMPTPTPLKYNRDGFLGDDKYNSQISVKGYTLHVSKCKNDLNVNALDIVIKLNYVDLKPSTMDIFKDITVEVYHNNQLLNGNLKVERNNISLITTISISGSDMDLTDYVFDINYIFNLNNTYFNNNDSPLWQKSQPVFKISSVLQIK